MGQKSNLNSTRISIVQPWKSSWCTEVHYQQAFAEEYKIREYLNNVFFNLKIPVSDISLSRYTNNLFYIDFDLYLPADIRDKFFMFKLYEFEIYDCLFLLSNSTSLVLSNYVCNFSSRLQFLDDMSNVYFFLKNKLYQQLFTSPNLFYHSSLFNQFYYNVNYFNFPNKLLVYCMTLKQTNIFMNVVNYFLSSIYRLYSSFILINETTNTEDCVLLDHDVLLHFILFIKVRLYISLFQSFIPYLSVMRVTYYLNLLSYFSKLSLFLLFSVLSKSNSISLWMLKCMNKEVGFCNALDNLYLFISNFYLNYKNYFEHDNLMTESNCYAHLLNMFLLTDVNQPRFKLYSSNYKPFLTTLENKYLDIKSIWFKYLLLYTTRFEFIEFIKSHYLYSLDYIINFCISLKINLKFYISSIIYQIKNKLPILTKLTLFISELSKNYDLKTFFIGKSEKLKLFSEKRPLISYFHHQFYFISLLLNFHTENLKDNEPIFDFYFFNHISLNQIVLNVEYYLNKYTHTHSIIMPNLYLLDKIPLNSSKLLAQYIAYEVEKGSPINELFRDLKSIFISEILNRNNMFKRMHRIEEEDVIFNDILSSLPYLSSSLRYDTIEGDYYISLFNDFVNLAVPLVREDLSSSLLSACKFSEYNLLDLEIYFYYIFYFYNLKTIESQYTDIEEHKKILSITSSLQSMISLNKTEINFYKSKSYLYFLKKYPIQGICIKASGSFKRGTEATIKFYKEGSLPRQYLRMDVEESLEHAFTRNGVIGIKVWFFFNSNQFEDEIELKSEAFLDELNIELDNLNKSKLSKQASKLDRRFNQNKSYIHNSRRSNTFINKNKFFKSKVNKKIYFTRFSPKK